MSDPMQELRERLRVAENRLDVLWRKSDGQELVRLGGKLEGVRLALGYIAEELSDAV